MEAKRSNSFRSGKGGKMQGSMDAWISVATLSSAPMRSRSAVTVSRLRMYSSSSRTRDAKPPDRLVISSL